LTKDTLAFAKVPRLLPLAFGSFLLLAIAAASKKSRRQGFLPIWVAPGEVLSFLPRFLPPNVRTPLTEKGQDFFIAIS